ncbi:MAG: DUF4861 domain-containing protein [Bacteroidales bacterium]
MKKSSVLRSISILFIMMLLVASCEPVERVIISITNPSATHRQDEPVVIHRDTLESWGLKFNVTKHPVVSIAGEIIPSQVDDLNLDGKWDELFFLVGVGANENVQAEIKLVQQKDVPVYSRRTNVRMAKIIKKGKAFEELSVALRLKGKDTQVTSKHYQFEGPGWENELIAFRNYLDERNGIDIFGKTTPGLVLDSIGVNGDYHTLLPWGMDILKVGNSLGAGSLALLSGDTLARAATPSKSEFHLICEGPVRSVLRLQFDHWRIGNQDLDLTHEISIWGGMYGYQSTVTLNGFTDSLTLMAGIVNMLADSLNIVSTAEYTIMATWEKQAYNGEYLGLALVLPNEFFRGGYEAPEKERDVTESYCAKLSMVQDRPVTFRFYAGWERSNPDFATETGFLNMLKMEVQRMEIPLVISRVPE